MAKIIFIVCLFLSFTFAVEKEPFEIEIGFDKKLSTDSSISLLIKSNIDNLEIRKIALYTPEKESLTGWINEINKTKYTIIHFSDKDIVIVVTNNNLDKRYKQDDFIKKYGKDKMIIKLNKGEYKEIFLADYFKDCKNEKSNCKAILSTNLGDFNIDIESLPVYENWKKYASPKEED
ncbi:hypothetical protein [Campylobacter concisus]